MGGNATKAPLNQQEAAKAALIAVSDAAQKAIMEVIMLDKVESEKDVIAAAEEVVELVTSQVRATAVEVIIRNRSALLKQAREARLGLRAATGPEILASDLLFHEFFNDTSSNDVLDSGVGLDSSKQYKADSTIATIAHPWKKIKKLGKGAFGSVYSAVDKNGFKFAAKEVPRIGSKVDFLRKEIEFLKDLTHRNIIQFYGCAGDEEKYYMYIELMHGSLRDVIDETGRPITEVMSRSYTRDILQGLIYLHRKNVIHRDIKCANVLLDGNETAKLADMGMAKIHDHTTIAKQPVEYLAGTIPWMSPETLKKKESGKRSDVWSVGCTVYEMLRGKAPFLESLPQNISTLVLRRMIFGIEHKRLVRDDKDFGPAIKDFLMRIFVSMNERPYANEVAKHPWLKEE